MHPTQAIEIFGNVSMPFDTLAISELWVKISRRSSQGAPPSGEGGFNAKGVAKHSDFGHFVGYISETMQDIISAVSYTHLTLPTNREV